MEPQRQDTVTAEPSAADYDSFCTTVMASARGRWFLAEYARRHRKADTDAVLAALHRIEDLVCAAPPADSIARLRDDLHALAATVREARRDLGANGGALSTASKVMALLDLLEQRIEYSLAPGDDHAPLPPSTQDKHATEPEMNAQTKPDAARARLSIVAATNEPMPPRIDPAAFPSAALLPPLDPADAGPNLVVLARKVQNLPHSKPLRDAPAGPHQLFAASERAAAHGGHAGKAQSIADRFADVMALSEEERIALFT